MIGNALVVLGLSMPVTDALLLRRFPLQWGGDNFTAYWLVSLGCVLALVGVVLLLTAVRGLPRPRRRLHLGACLTVNGVLVALVVAGCWAPYDDGRNGQMGVTVTATGSPALFLGVCHGAGVDEVVVETEAAARKGDAGAMPVARLRHRDAVTTFTSVDLTSPAAGWTGRTLPAASSTTEHLVAFARGQRGELDAVVFTLAQVRQLSPGEVLWTDYADPDGRMVTRRAPAEDYRAKTCDLHYRT